MKSLHLLTIPLAASLSFYGCGTSDNNDDDDLDAGPGTGSDTNRGDAQSDAGGMDSDADDRDATMPDAMGPQDAGSGTDAGPAPANEAAALAELSEAAQDFCDTAAACGEFPSADACFDEFQTDGPDFNTVDASTRVACINGYRAFIACAAEQPCETISADEPPEACFGLLAGLQVECEGLDDGSYEYEYEYDYEPE